MADHLGFYNTASSRTTVRFAFTTHAATGAPVAPNSAFEAADLLIYKDGSNVQRTSANGVTMTSPFDTITGLHHVSIDLTDNTDAGFYAAGSWYMVVLSPDETVDSLAVAKVLAYFEIGVAKADVTQFAGTAITSASGIPEVKVASIANNAITAASIATDAIDADAIAADAIGSSELAAGAVTEIQSGLATAASLTTVEGKIDVIDGIVDSILVDTGTTLDGKIDTIDTNVDAILVDTGTTLDGNITAIKTKTDQLTFTVANQVDSNALTVDEDEILDDQLADSVPADGSLPTVRQALYMIWQFLSEKSVAGTTLTVKKADGTTSLMTFTLDDGSNPTSITRAT